MKKKFIAFSMMIFSCASIAKGFDSNYGVYTGDINSDGITDLYIKRDKPEVTLLHSVPLTPIKITEIDGFVLAQNSDGTGFSVKITLTPAEAQNAEGFPLNSNLSVLAGPCSNGDDSDLVVSGLVAEGISLVANNVSVYAHENKDPGSFIASPYTECQEIVENSLVVSSFTQGRKPGTVGSQNAVDFLVKRLQKFSDGFYGGRSLSSYKQPYSFSTSNGDSFTASGTNVVAKIPGTGIHSDEVVVIGAHYDHLGDESSTPTYCHNNGNFASTDVNDSYCNGATDNATGVAVVLQAASEIAKQVHLGNLSLDRTLLIAFWDGEEISTSGVPGLLGSADFVSKSDAASLPGFDVVPLSKIHAYINVDIAGLNLLPSLKGTTFVQGAETGGAAMESIVNTAISNAVLNANQATPSLNFNPERLSYPFGHDRSDHTRFTGFPLGFGNNFQAQNGVPTVFLSDANGACYHTIGDDMDVVDFEKLTAQTDLIRQITEGLLNSTSLDAPVAYIHDANRLQMAQYVTLDDVEVMRDVFASAMNDSTQNYSPANTATLTSGHGFLDGFVSGSTSYVAGAPNFHGALVLGEVSKLLAVLHDGTCEKY